MLFNCLAPLWIFHATPCRKQPLPRHRQRLLISYSWLRLLRVSPLYFPCIRWKLAESTSSAETCERRRLPRRKEASLMKNDFAEVKETRKRTERMPHHKQITISVCRGRCFHAISNSWPQCMMLWIILTKVQGSFLLTERGWIINCASLSLFLLAFSPSKPCVGLINQVHVSLTDTWRLKQCKLKKSCSVNSII